ncbi:MAG: hypothetical protein LBB57_07285 [Clostridiales Family XIII bacterium]|nr:hypothetical protein [Clostridiales Family XIII bacterium]
MCEQMQKERSVQEQRLSNAPEEELQISAEPQTLSRSESEEHQNAQIQRIAIAVTGADPTASAEPSPELLRLRNKSSLSKKEKKRLKEMENELRTAEQERMRQQQEEQEEQQRQQEEQRQRERQQQEEQRQQQEEQRRQRREEAERAEEEENRQMRDRMFEAMSEEEADSPLSLQSFVAMQTTQDKAQIKRTLLAMAEKLAEIDTEWQTAGYSDAIAIKQSGYRHMIANYVADRTAREAILIKLNGYMAQRENLQVYATRLRTIERGLKNLFWNEFTVLHDNDSSWLDAITAEMLDEYDQAAEDMDNAFDREMAKALGVSEEAERELRNGIKAKEVRESNGLFEALGQEAATEQLAEARAQRFTALKDTLQANGSKTAPENAAQQAFGGAFKKLAADHETAARIVVSANGYLYADQSKDGTYILKPTLPETATVHDITESGPPVVINLRENYNRLTKMIAAELLRFNENPDFADNLRTLRFGLADAKIEEFESDFRELFKDSLADARVAGESPVEKARIRDMLVILRDILPSETFNTISSFAAMAKQEAENTADAEKKEARKRDCANYLMEQQNELKAPEETAADYRARIEATLEQIDALSGKWQGALAQMQTLASLDINGRDVFLPGTCSSNRDTLGRLRGDFDASMLRNDAHFQDDLYFEQRKDFVIERLANLSGRKKEVFEAMSVEELREACVPYTDYEYHVGAHIGELREEGAFLTLEAFAAGAADIVSMPFTQNVAIGVYREYQFANYYRHDDSLFIRPQDLLLAALRKAKKL